jgi:AcrR family transcriptional regulator
MADRVLDAAADLFYSEGYETSIDAIASRAQIAKPTVYAHFSSKDALIEAVLERGSVAFFDDLDAEVTARSGDAESQLMAPFDLLVTGLPDPAYHGCICINAAATFTSPDHASHRILAELEDRMLAIFAELCAAAGAREPVALARRLMLLFDGVKARGLVDPSGSWAADAKDAVKALLRSAQQDQNGDQDGDADRGQQSDPSGRS